MFFRSRRDTVRPLPEKKKKHTLRTAAIVLLCILLLTGALGAAALHQILPDLKQSLHFKEEEEHNGGADEIADSQ